MAKTLSRNGSINFTIPSNEAEEMIRTPIPNGSITDNFSCKEKEAAYVSNCYTEEENENHVNETFLGGAKPPIESGSSLRGCKRLALALSVVAFLASFAVLLYVIVMFATKCTHRKHEENTTTIDEMQAIHPEVCLDCERLIQNTYTQPGSDPVFEGLTSRIEGNVMKCCAGSQGQMSIMLKLVRSMLLRLTSLVTTMHKV